MASATAVATEPVMAGVVICLLVIAATLVLGIVVIVKWILKWMRS